jgi:putative ABC transport system permease protein
MNVLRLIVREILYRKLNFLLALLSVSVAVGGVLAALSLLRQHDVKTEQIIAQQRAQMQREMAKLEDDFRKITLGMGFNVLILPKDQNLADMYADDYATKYMPEEYATRLGQSRLATINHILPSLQQKVRWPEIERTIQLIGVRGEVYMQSSKQKPLLESVPAGSIVLGYELHRGMKVKVGDSVQLMGRPLKVIRTNVERGNKDDITAWINLGEAQEILQKKGQINAILALDCTCATDRLSLIRPEIAKILPDTQVIEFASQALARAEARQRAGAQAESSIAAEETNRANLRRQREALAAALVPALIVASGLIIALLAWGNVRDRRSEIGLFRAVGMRSRQILAIFLGKAAIVGLAGAGAGVVVGIVIAWYAAEGTVVSPRVLVLMICAAPLLAMAASWLPALVATQRNPAEILHEN